MKVAIVCEGRLEGEDAQVFEHFAKRIAPQVATKTFPLGNKLELFDKAGDVVAALFSEGYTRVLIMWDIQPRWKRPDGEPQDLQDLQLSLDGAGVGNHPCLFRIAIHKELEAWLLADGSALSKLFSTPEHPVKIKDIKNADQEANPKKRLEKLFAKHNVPFGPQPAQGDYQPKLAAIRIAENIPDKFGQLAKLGSFKKFGRSLTVTC